ncbi:pyridoxamine 5'-phosphate oxidase family protein [Afipia clevelandensis]|uniref:pyridoxamine 5'-phosphate oxidase family protein n=1 Tax=Afipia clevelandensis TaxID=1034 RepID=UPI0015772751
MKEHGVTSIGLDELGAIYAPPTDRVIAKQLARIDRHAANFIGLSPFCVLATSGPDGTVDASPRGGNPGFIRIENETRLLMPDRPGNNRIDSFRNVLSGSGYVQLLFFVPGLDETLRVGGDAKLSADADVLAAMIEFGKLPRAVLDIAVREVYFHCGKALMRSKLWSPDSRVARSAQPSISEVIHEQTGQGTPESQDAVEARYKTQL